MLVVDLSQSYVNCRLNSSFFWEHFTSLSLGVQSSFLSMQPGTPASSCLPPRDKVSKYASTDYLFIHPGSWFTLLPASQIWWPNLWLLSAGHIFPFSWPSSLPALWLGLLNVKCYAGVQVFVRKEKQKQRYVALAYPLLMSIYLYNACDVDKPL